MNPTFVNVSTLELLSRAVSVQARLDEAKAWYKDLDSIVSELAARGFMRGSVDGLTVSLVDAFETKATAWKAMAFRRYELAVAAETKAP